MPLKGGSGGKLLTAGSNYVQFLYDTSGLPFLTGTSYAKSGSSLQVNLSGSYRVDWLMGNTDATAGTVNTRLYHSRLGYVGTEFAITSTYNSALDCYVDITLQEGDTIEVHAKSSNGTTGVRAQNKQLMTVQQKIFNQT